MFIQYFAFQTGQRVTHTNGLQRDGRQHTPVWRRSYLLGKPLCIRQIAPQACLQSFYTLLTDETP